MERILSDGGTRVSGYGRRMFIRSQGRWTDASVEPISEDDDLPFWKINDGTHREISRVAVAPAHQGKRLAEKLVGMLLEELKRNGVSSVHLLAAKKNPPAFHTYRALGFDFIGECYRYGADYFVCEKILMD